LDEVYHFASPASPADFERIPIPILKVGALGTYNALGLAKDRGARLMLASTSEVYGDPLVHPQPEGYWGNVNPIGIRGVYDEAKRYAESITMAYHRHHRVDTRIVRIFNTYGPRIRPDDGRMIPNFIQQALSGRPLTIYGDGNQTRSVQYVDDLLEGVIRLMKSPEVHPVNIGNPVEHTVKEVAALIPELSNSASELVYEPLPQDNPKQRCPDVTRAREVLDWEPRVAAAEGLSRTIGWFSERHAEAKPNEMPDAPPGEGTPDWRSWLYRLARGRSISRLRPRRRDLGRPLERKEGEHPRGGSFLRAGHPGWVCGGLRGVQTRRSLTRPPRWTCGARYGNRTSTPT
jgi:dTDP-glucose 4,6-dehydratase